MLGSRPLSILRRGAPPTGGDYESGQPPCPPRPGRRRLGLALSGESQPPWAPAPRNPTPNPPGHQWESPREALDTFPSPRGTRQTRPGRARGHCPCAGWRHGGHGQSGLPHTVSPTESAASTTHSAGCPTGMGRDAAPVWCHPRRREEAATGHASRDRGRHPTDARTVGATPRRAAGATVASGWLRLCQCTADKSSMKT